MKGVVAGRSLRAVDVIPHTEDHAVACARWPETFASTEPTDHADARVICSRCPLAANLTCLRRGISLRAHGTWGGVLLKSGKPV